MAQVVYACRFDVPGTERWHNIYKCYAEWILSRYRRTHEIDIRLGQNFAEISGELPRGHHIEFRKFEAQETAYEIEWTYPGEGGIIWTNSTRVGAFQESCALEHKVTISSSEYLVSPARYFLGAPGIVRRISDTANVLVGKMQLRKQPYTISDQNIEQFIELLISNDRRLPIVLITPFANDDQNYIDPGLMADRLAGVGVVTVADTASATRALSERLGPLACYDGGARIYWPGFTTEDDIRAHPLFLGSRIATYGPNKVSAQIEHSIFSVAAFRFVPDERIENIVRAVDAARRTERVQEATRSGDITWEQYALEIAAQLDSTLADLEIAKKENSNLRENQKLLFSFPDLSDKADEPADVDEWEAKTVAEAVAIAMKKCSYLHFLDTSVSSAKESPFRRPAEILSDLTKMDQVAGVWAKNEGGGDLRQMLIESGLGRRVSNFISQTTKSKWGKSYTFRHDGHDILFEWHVTLGSGAADTCASIHFFPDADTKKIIIGHVGRHLPNTRS